MGLGINLVRFFAWANQSRKPRVKQSKGRAAIFAPLADALEARRLMTLNVWIQNDNRLVVAADDNVAQSLEVNYDAPTWTYTITSQVATEDFSTIVDNSVGLTITNTPYNPGTFTPATLTIVDPTMALGAMSIATGDSSDLISINIANDVNAMPTLYLSTGGGSDSIDTSINSQSSILVLDSGTGIDELAVNVNSATATQVAQNIYGDPYAASTINLDTTIDGVSSNIFLTNLETVSNQLNTPLATVALTINGQLGLPSGTLGSNSLQNIGTRFNKFVAADVSIFGQQSGADILASVTSTGSQGIQVKSSGLPTADIYGITPQTGVLRLLGLNGNDTIKASAGVEIFTSLYMDGGDGNDIISGDATMLGGAGDDTFIVPAGINTIDGGAGNNAIEIDGTIFSDSILANQVAGTLIVNVNGAISTNTIANIQLITVEALAGDDQVFISGDGIIATRVEAGDGNDLVDGSVALAPLTINGGAGDDTLKGGSGIDYIDGGDGFDRIYGGIGNDSIEGGDGGDIVYWSAGDGLDVVDGGSGDNQLNFTGAPSATNSFVVGASPIFLNGVDVTLNNALNGANTANIQSLIVTGGNLADNVLVTDLSGTTLTALKVDLGGSTTFGGMVTFNGTTGNDILGVGGSGSNVYVTGLTYTATVTGYNVTPTLGSIDTIRVNGNAGYDTLFVNASLIQPVAVVLDGGIGNDKLFSEAPNYFQQPDSLYRITLIGNNGINEFMPSAGRVVARGSGSDVMHLDGNDLDNTISVSQTGNIIDFTLDSLTTQIDVTNYTGLLEINSGAGNDNATLSGFTFAASVFGGNGNDTIDATAMITPVTAYGDAGNDLIGGGSANDTIYGGDGSDQLAGNDGEDVLYGEAGEDKLSGGADNDALFGGADADLLAPGTFFGLSPELVDGGTGTDQVVFTFNGMSGLVGRTAGFLNVGEFGSTGLSVSFNSIDVENVLAYADTTVAGASGFDFTIQDLTGSQVNFVRVNFTDPNEQNTLSMDGTNGDDNISAAYVLPPGGEPAAGINMPWGTIWASTPSAATPQNTLSIQGSNGNDTIKADDNLSKGAFGWNILLDGGDGNDYLSADATLIGGSGNDTLIGGSGNDSLDGGAGDDLFIPTVGLDTIEGGTGFDIVLLAGSVGMDNAFAVFQNTATPVILNVNASSYNAVLSNIDQVSVQGSTGSDSLTVGGNLASPVPVLGMMAEGSDWVSTWSASAGQITTIYGQGGDDTMLSGAGTDNFFGGDDFDTFEAGPLSINSNDLFDGGSGYNALTVDNAAAGSSVITPIPSGYLVTNTAGTGSTTALNIGSLKVNLTLGGGVVINGSNNDDNIRTFDVDSDLVPPLPAGVVLVTGLPGEVTITGVTPGSPIDIHGQGGNDTFQDLGDFGAVVTFYGDSGNDTFIVNQESEPATFSGGAGTDSVSLQGTVGDDVLGSMASGIQEALYIGANLSGTINDAEILNIDGLAGNDHIQIYSLAAPTGLAVFNLTGGDGTDLISATGLTSGTYNIDGGNGDDLIGGPDAGATVVVHGGSGNDDIRLFGAGGSAFADAGNDIMSAGTGAVAFYGGSGDDSITGGSGADYLDGGDGYDYITGGLGNDSIEGGSGSDSIYYNAGDGQDVIDGGEGTNLLIVHGLANAGNTINVSPGIASPTQFTVDVNGLAAAMSVASIHGLKLVGGIASDTFNIADMSGTTLQNATVDFGADQSPDTVNLTGTANKDYINVHGNPGGTSVGVGGLAALVSIVSATAGSGGILLDTVNVDSSFGDDTMIASPSLGTIPVKVGLIGSGGYNLLIADAPALGSAPRVTVDGSAGLTDTFWLQNGNNVVLGTASDQIVVNATPNSDTITATGDATTLNLSVNGVSGTNDVTGFKGVMQINALAGNDSVTLGGFLIPTTLDGGDGSDSINATAMTVPVSLNGGSGDDQISGGSAADVIDGGSGNDMINGYAGDDNIYGGDGSDTIQWEEGGGDDSVDGGTGDDRLVFLGSHALDNAITLTPATTPVPSTAVGIGKGNANMILAQRAGDGSVTGGSLESVELAGGLGCDTMGIGNLQSTDVRVVDASIYNHEGHGAVSTWATNLPDTITVVADTPDQIGINGLAVPVRVFGAKPNATAIVVHAGFGADNIEVDPQAEAQAIIVVDGGAGNDTISGGSVIIGGSGNNLLIGSDLPNTIVGGTGSDTIYGLGAGDLLFGDALVTNVDNLGPNCDYLAGLVITPTLTGAPDLIDGGDGDDTINGNIGDDTIHGGAGNNVMGEITWNSVFFPEPGNDVIDAGDGDNEVHSGDGNDQVTLGNGNNCVFGGEGDNTVTVGNGDNRIVTGTGNDTITAGNGNNTIFAGAGDDSVTTGSGNDVVVLGAGNDKATLGDGADLAWGEEGNDFIIGGMGDDTIYGGSGNDTLWGGTHATLPVKSCKEVVRTPNDGNDVLAGEDGFDQLDGGTGNNIMDAGADYIRETMVGSGGWDTAYIHKDEGKKQDVLKNHSHRYTLIPYGAMPVADVPATPTDCTSPIDIVIPDPLSGKTDKPVAISAAVPKPTTKVVSNATAKVSTKSIAATTPKITKVKIVAKQK